MGYFETASDFLCVYDRSVASGGLVKTTEPGDTGWSWREGYGSGRSAGVRGKHDIALREKNDYGRQKPL